MLPGSFIALATALTFGSQDCTPGWSALGSIQTPLGAPSEVWSLARAFVGGRERIVATARFPGIGSARVVAWDGRAWQVLGDYSGPSLGYTRTFGGTLFSGSNAWTGASWVPSSSLGADIRGFATLTDSQGSTFYARGQHWNGPGRVQVVMQWDGQDWLQVGSNFTYNPPADDAGLWALATFDDGTGPSLYAAGLIRHCGGVETLGVARWDGGAWVGVAGGIDRANVRDLVASPADGPGGLFAAVAGGQTPAEVQRYDGQTWTSIGATESTGWIYDLGFLDSGNGPELVAMGRFTSIGELEASGIARWTGTDWQPFGHTIAGPVPYAIVNVPDGPLHGTYMIGSFTSVGGVQAPGVVRWGCPLSICLPDLTATAVPGEPGYGIPNGVLNNDDFFYFLAQFAAGNLAVADLTTTAVPGQPGYGVPNGAITNDDFFYYLTLFAAGC